MAPESRRVPQASSAEARRRMLATRRRDTKPELAIRALLHRWGYRYRVDVAPVPGLRRRADILFPRVRLAVFVDGCFWHGCPIHGTWPKANAGWWRAKIEANRSRDRDTDSRLEEEGWYAVRVWEHEEPREAAERIALAYGLARARLDA